MGLEALLWFVIAALAGYAMSRVYFMTGTC